MRKRGKKAQANIFVVILLVLIALVAIGIIWNVVIPLLEEKGAETVLDPITTNLQITEVVLFELGSSIITVNRQAGQGDINELRFVFHDEEENRHVEARDSSIKELATEIFYFSPISNFGKIKRPM